MKFLIIGHSVVDNISDKNEIIDKPGGIFFSAAAMDSCKSKDDEIYISTAISKNYKHLFYPIYKNLKNDFLELVDEIPKVKLRVHQNKLFLQNFFLNELIDLMLDRNHLPYLHIRHQIK